MTEPVETPPLVATPDIEANRKRIIAARNRATAWVLVGFVVLFFAITIVKMKI